MLSSVPPPLISWFRVLLLLNSLINFSTAKPVQVSRNGTSLNPRLIGQYRVMNCNSAQEKAIEDAISELEDMASSVTTRIATLQEYFIEGKAVDFSKLPNDVWSTYDTFQTIFGYQIYAEGGVDSDSIIVVDYVKLAFQELYLSLFDLDSKSLDLWCDSAWETEENDKGDVYKDASGNIDTNYLWDNSGNNFGWIEPDTDGKAVVCSDSYETTSAGYNLNDGYDASIITICTSEMNRVISSGKSLASYRGEAFTEDAVSIHNIANDALSFLLLHEFTHATALMGTYFTNDKNLPNGTPAYGWSQIVALASDATTKGSAIRNADSLAFFAAAMYLSKNTWWDGLSKDLSYTSEWAETLDFLENL